MIRIQITAAAYQAIAAGSNPDSLLEPQRSPDGGFYLWLFKPIVEKLKAARGPGESFSDTIVRLANDQAAA